MVNDKRYAPIAAELEDVAKRLGMEVWEVEELIYRKAEERYHLEDIKACTKIHTKKIARTGWQERYLTNTKTAKTQK